MTPPATNIIYTIGHSTLSIEELVHLLTLNRIEFLADVRTVPKSRSNPQFNRDVLPAVLSKAAIGYRHFPALGGWRQSKLEQSPNMGWDSTSFRNYADYMMTEKFEAGLAELIDLSHHMIVVIMCAEVLPWRCHRTLISDALTIRGFHVMHIMGQKSVHEHTITPWAHVSGTAVTYPPQPDKT
jgi:uncharacterized protein (DUF488 family)